MAAKLRPKELPEADEGGKLEVKFDGKTEVKMKENVDVNVDFPKKNVQFASKDKSKDKAPFGVTASYEKAEEVSDKKYKVKSKKIKAKKVLEMSHEHNHQRQRAHHHQPQPQEDGRVQAQDTANTTTCFELELQEPTHPSFFRLAKTQPKQDNARTIHSKNTSKFKKWYLIFNYSSELV